MRHNKYGNCKYMSEVEEMDESGENIIRTSNRLEVNNNIRISKNQGIINHNFIQNKLNYDDFIKNTGESEIIDLEKFYETKQQKIEEILLKKSIKMTPQFYFKDKLKNDSLNKQVNKNNTKTIKIAASPNKEFKRSKSAISPMIKKYQNNSSKKVISPSNAPLRLSVNLGSNYNNINIVNHDESTLYIIV